MVNKHEAVWNWLQTCPYITDMFFNAGRADGGCTTMVPAESVKEEYIDGSSLRSYECTLVRYMEISFEPNDGTNIEDQIDFDQLGEWVEAQNASKNFPEFPGGQAVQEINVSPNQAGYMVMFEQGMAKYQLQFQIDYVKER